ncbi:acyltransferase [Lentzea sp. NBRC 105346]|uniref:acyltransferase family protein n=1 Tax=Lentzea sp. NBRC 105346 TaxID=3032205 RepID=UPI0025561A5F|nr:acyltransferase [Lentzea sp. NBRC 105346]
MTGLRGLLAALAFLAHFFTLHLLPVDGHMRFVTTPTPSILVPITYAGMNVFFAMSGFVMAWAARPDDTAQAFWKRRFARLFPIYFVTTVLAAGALVVLHMPVGLDNFLLHVFLLQAWVPDQGIIYGINPVSWSLSVEVFFYLVFPAMLVLLSRATDRMLRITVVVALVLAWWLPYLVGDTFTLAQTGGSTFFNHSEQGGEFTFWFTMIFPGFRLVDFVSGAAVGMLMRRGSWRGPSMKVTLIIVAVMFVVDFLFLPNRIQRVGGLLPAVLLLMAALSQADLSGRMSWLRVKPFTWFGDRSYSFYLVHVLAFLPLQPVILNLYTTLGIIPAPSVDLPVPLTVFSCLLYFTICTFAAWALHKYVEVPMSRRLRKAGPTSARSKLRGERS